jgi:outer membrane protein assembly factor BamB
MMCRYSLVVFLGVLCDLCGYSSSLAAEPWATARGNPARTGCADGVALPPAVKPLWVHRSQDSFVAPPVPAGDRLIVAGLGGFNVARLTALPIAGGEPAWVKTTPYLKLPVVCTPAVSGGRLVLGDGMHQNDGAVLHGLRVSDGLPLWQRPAPGQLVHLEGTPTVEGGRVYSGGGAAGVLCVDPTRLTLAGKEVDADAAAAAVAARWKELLAKFEAEKKKDPDFAVPPSEDQLPRAEPKTVWQQGTGKWHVDAPVNVSGGLVLAASAFLDKEQTGERALFALDAGTGEVRWRQPLAFNPWGGAAVLGPLVVVAGSSVRYDPATLKGAKGEVAAFDLATGTPKWRKDVTGGILGGVALADGVAVAAATDGKLRAFDLATGERRWVYDAKAPLFAPAAVVGGIAYAADLAGVVHAVGAADGKARWTLDLGRDPAVGAPGMVYGGPVAHGGRLYVATCNLEGPHKGKPTVVVCLGAK